MQYFPNFAYLSLLVTLLSPLALADTLPMVEHIETLVNAKAIERVEPKYPVSAARSGQEGWVKVSFVIDKEGKVVDPVIQDSSGLRGFEKETLKAVKQWKYSPALQDGKPIEQCQMELQMDFRLFGGVGVTKKFMREYSRIVDAISANNLTEAQEILAELGDAQLWNLTESGYYYFVDAMYAKEVNDKERELASMERAAAAGPASLKADSYLYLLERQFILYLDAAQYAKALSTFDTLAKQPNTHTQVSFYQPYADKLKSLIEGNNPLIRKAKIDSNGIMYHRLSRDSFSLAVNKGELDEVQIRCANKRSRFTVAEHAEWTIPGSWGQCTIFVTGAPDTQFNVVELGKHAKAS